MPTLQLKVKAQPSDQDLLIAGLLDHDVLGFEQTNTLLVAYFEQPKVERSTLEPLVFGFDHEFSVVDDQNWNAMWESNFDPIEVGTFCSVRAGFHQASGRTKWDIVITPKMSFGTGHHATTYMMIEAMKGIDLEEKTVLDFGTGTGVLAILAEKSGACKVDAIDLDEWSITNAQENFGINQVQKIFLHQADTIRLPELYDVILANINKNVLLENMHSIRSHLAADGVVVLSGLLKSDCNDIVEAAAAAGFALAGLQERGGWIAMKLGPRQY